MIRSCGVARAFAADYRRAITAITLLGRLASTVFIPVTRPGGDLRLAPPCWSLALIELPICAGIYLKLLLRGRETAVVVATASTASRRAGVVGRAMRQPVYWLLVASSSASPSFFHAAPAVQPIVPLLRERSDFTDRRGVADLCHASGHAR